MKNQEKHRHGKNNYMIISNTIKNDGILLTGDANEMLDKIADEAVNLTITSPPYNKKGTQKGWLVDKVEYEKHDDILPEKQYQENQINILNKIYKITTTEGSLFYNHKIRWEKGQMYHPMDWLRDTEWVIKQEIVWDRTIAANIRGWRFWQVEERIYWLYKPEGKKLIGKELESCDAKLTSIWRGIPVSGKKNAHPAPFPIWLQFV